MSNKLARSFLPVRPAGAFGLISLGLICVGAKVVVSQDAALFVEAGPRHIRVSSLDYAEPPLFELVDRNGTSLARSVRANTLEASPFHLWLVHTPERILSGLLSVLGDQAPPDLEQRLLGTDDFGWCTSDAWHLLPTEAREIAGWIERGGPSRQSGVGPLHGFSLEVCPPDPDAAANGDADVAGPLFRVRWCPIVLLSENMRRRLDPDLFDDVDVKASEWVRALSEDLWKLLAGPRERALARRADAGLAPPVDWEVVPEASGLGRLLEGVVEAPPSWRVSAAVPHWQLASSKREWVLGGLVSTRYAKVCSVLPTELVERLREFLAEEHVGSYQLWLRPTSERAYPSGRFAALGRVGWRDDDATQRHGLWGLEHAAEVALATLEPGLERPGAFERFERDVLVRSRAADQEYYREHGAGRTPAEVVLTIDERLQTRAAQLLEELEDTNHTSVAMAVVVDLDTRDVLALDWRDPYEIGLFHPIQHRYTPGSTFKVVTMALALDAGRVSPSETFDVGWGRFNIPGTSRWVGEAEGFATGIITAGDCLARSSNAGMIQIGLRLAPEEWQRRTRDFGYGVALDSDLLAEGMDNPSGIIGERAASRYDKPWSRHRSHASVCFGDSMSVSFLQHTTALCAAVHDGRLRPLRFVEAARLGSELYDAPRSEGPEVVRASTSRTLLKMMQLGADEGTGKTIRRPDGLALATKTGTYEKLPGDVSYHVLGTALRDARERGEEWNGAAAHKRYRGNWGGDASSYTSSIVMVGWIEGTTRRVLVHVLAEDPLGEEHFGSRVTGPAAVGLVAAALGIDVDQRRATALASGRDPLVRTIDVPTLEALPERPWEMEASR